MNLFSGIGKAYQILLNRQKFYLIIIFCFLFITMLLEVLSVALIIPISEAFLNEENLIILQIKDVINNSSLFSSKFEFITILMFIIFFFFIIKFIVLIFINIIQSKIIFKIFTEISERLISKYLNLDLLNYNIKSSGELTRNVNSEPAVFINQFSINLIIVLKEILIFIGIIVFLLINSAKITMLIIFLTLIASLLFIAITSRFQINLAKNRQLNDGKRLNSIIQILNGFKVIKIFQLKNFFLKEFILLNRSMAKIGVKQNFIKSFPKFYIELIMVVIFIFILNFYKNDESSYNEIITSISLILVSVVRLMPVIKNINVSYAGVLSGLPSVNLIHNDLFKKKINKSDKNFEVINFQKKLSLKDINFLYRNSQSLIFEDLNLEISKNDSIGFVGESGSGKTTLINIIMGLINLNNGEIIVDDMKLTDSKLLSWQSKIGFIPQETFLANTTIKNNICLGIKDDQINKNKLKKTIIDANLESLIQSKKNGLNENIGENGNNLSGGQKQKISLARALYFDREILIFDEPTSALDKDSQLEVEKTINNLIGKKTIILVSHTKDIMKNFNKIFEVKNKKLNLITIN